MEEEKKEDKPTIQVDAKKKNTSIKKKNTSCKKKNKWMIVSIVLFIFFIASFFTDISKITNFVGKKSTDQMGEKAIAYINSQLLTGDIQAKLLDSSKEDGCLYKIKFELNGQEYDSYITNDGKTFFPQGLPMEDEKSVAENEESEKEAQEIPKTEKSDTKLFVMSYCPYGNQAEDLINPVVGLLGDKANIELRYIVSKSGEDYNSLHGVKELDQNVREICVQKYEKDKFWKFIEEINAKTTLEDAENKWEGIAKELGIDIAKIKKCASEERVALLDAEVAITEKYKVDGSPKLIINDTNYSGGKTSEAYKTAICSGFQVEPEECKNKLSDEATSSSDGGCQ